MISDQDQTCFLGHAGKYFVRDLFIVTQGTYDPCFREKIVIAALSENVGVINIFHDVNSTSDAVTNIHHKSEFLLKAVVVFHSVNVTLFTVKE